MMNGHGVYTWTKDNRTYEGRFVNDNMTGQGWYQESDRVIVGEFQNGVLHGKGVQFSVEANLRTRIIVGNVWFLGDLLNGFEIVMNNNVVESLKQHRKRVDDSSANHLYNGTNNNNSTNNTNNSSSTTAQPQANGSSSGGASSPVTVHSVISFVDRSEMDTLKSELSDKKQQLLQAQLLEKKLEKAEQLIAQQSEQLLAYESERQKIQQYLPQVNEQFLQQKQLAEQYESTVSLREREYQEQMKQLEESLASLKEKCEQNEQLLEEQRQEMETSRAQWEQQLQQQVQLVQQKDQLVQQQEQLAQEQEQMIVQSKSVISELEQQISVLESEVEQQRTALLEAQERNTPTIAVTGAATSTSPSPDVSPVDDEHSTKSSNSSVKEEKSVQTDTASSSSELSSPMVSPRSYEGRGIIETTSTPKVSENPFVKKMSMGRIIVDRGVDQDGNPIPPTTPRGTPIRKPVAAPVEEKVVDFRAHLRKTNMLENLDQKRNL